MATIAGPSTDDVFINCPFDPDYAPIFRALVFAVHALGFKPRTARELDDCGQTRIDKLYTLIEDCRYGVHDLSRTELDPVNRLPRFNMPLEPGIFPGARRFGDEQQARKRAPILDIEPYRYQRFISDLAGVDIHAHGEATRAITELRDWLANVSRRELQSGPQLIRSHERFCADRPDIAAKLELDRRRSPMWISSGSWSAGWWRRRRAEVQWEGPFGIRTSASIRLGHRDPRCAVKDFALGDCLRFSEGLGSVARDFPTSERALRHSAAIT